MNSDSPTPRFSAVGLSGSCPWIKLHLPNLFQSEVSSGCDPRSSTVQHPRDTRRWSSVPLPLSENFCLIFDIHSMFESKPTSWTLRRGWKKRPMTSVSRGRWTTDPRCRGMWSQRHMKVRIQSFSRIKRFWDVQLTQRPIESMLWLEGKRSLDANQSLSDPTESI